MISISKMSFTIVDKYNILYSNGGTFNLSHCQVESFYIAIWKDFQESKREAVINGKNIIIAMYSYLWMLKYDI